MAKLQYSFPIISDPVKFELLCKQIWSLEWKDSNATLHGRSGQTQLGVDVYGIDKSKNTNNKTYSGIQSKKRDGHLFNQKSLLSEEQITNEIDDALKFDTGDGGKLSQLIIATTERRDVAYQKLERKLTKKYDFDIHIVGWDTINELISKHYEELIPEFYPEFGPKKEDLTTTLVSAVSSSTNSQLNLAKRNIESGNIDTALEILVNLHENGTSALSKEDLFKLHANTALIYSLKGKNEKVLEYLDRALSTDIRNEKWYSNKVGVLLYQQNYEKAQEIVDEGIEKFDTTYLKSLKAEVLFQSGENFESILKEYQPLAKKSEDIAITLAQMVHKQGMLSTAVELLELHVDLTKKYNYAHMHAMSYLAGLYLEGVTHRENWMLGHFSETSLHEMNRAQEILDYILSVVEDKQIRPHFADSYSRRSLLNIMKDNKVQAISDAKTAFDLNAQDEQIAATYANLLSDEGMYSEAHNVLQQDSENLRHIFLDGMVYGEEKDYSNQEKCFKKVLEQEEITEQKKIAYVAYIQSLIKQAKYDDALKVIEQFEAEFEITSESLYLKAVISYDVTKDVSETVDYLLKSAKAIKDDTFNETIAGIGARLSDFKKYAESITVLSRIVSVHTYDILLRKLIDALWQERRFSEALDLCSEAIRLHGPEEFLIDIMYNIAVEKSDYKQAIALLESVIADTSSNSHLIKLSYLYSQDDQTRRAMNLLERINEKELTHIEDISNYAYLLADLGKPLAARKYLYSAALRDRTIPEIQRDYISVVLMNGDIPFEVSENVSPGFTVHLKTASGSIRIITVEDNEDLVDIGQNRYSPEHPVSRPLLGKSVGDDVEIGDNEYVVEKIIDKHFQLFVELRDTFNENFPDHQFLWKIKVLDDNGDLITENLNQFLSNGNSQVEQVIDNIQKAIFPLPTAAQITGKSYVDHFYAHLMEPELFIPSSTISELPENLPSTVVFDLSTVIVFYESDVTLPSLAGVKFLIPASSVRIIEARLKESRKTFGSKNRTGQLFSRQGQVNMVKYSKDGLKADVDRLEGLTHWIKSNLDVVPLSKPDVLSRSDYERFKELIGPEWADLITEILSATPSSILISEDLALRKLLRSELQDSLTANGQQLLEHLRNMNLIDELTYFKHLTFLVNHGFKHTYLREDDLINAFKWNELKLDDKTQPLLSILSDNSVLPLPVIGIALRFLLSYWKEKGSQKYWNSVKTAVFTALSNRDDYTENSIILDLAIQKIFYALPAVANELIMTRKSL